MGALLELSRSFRTRTTICRVPPVACPEETDRTLCPEKIDVTRLVNPETTEAAVERQELFNKETYSDNIGSPEDRSGYQRLAVRRRQGTKKLVQDSVGSRQNLFAARKRAQAPFLQCEKETFVRFQAGTALEDYTRN
jgi:hypothetical protein